MYDCHIHSTFSTDSSMNAVEACETAILKGLDGIAFTDHLDIDFPEHPNEYNIDFDKYTAAMDKLKLDFTGRLKVLKGIEVGIMPHTLADSLKIIRSYKFDFVLASVHIIDGRDPYFRSFYEGRKKEEIYSQYLNNIINMVDSLEDFDIVSHLDYIIRSACYSDRALKYSEYSDQLDVLFKRLILMGKGFEVNTASYRETPENSPVPEYDVEILRRYRELGGEIISIGSDSHSKEYIGYKFEYFKELLLKAGFKYTVHFEGRKPVFDKI